MTRVLVVDDDRALARALAINLKARGYVVEVATTGADALKAACRKLWMISGLNTFNSKLPMAPPTLIATSLPST